MEDIKQKRGRKKKMIVDKGCSASLLKPDPEIVEKRAIDFFSVQTDSTHVNALQQTSNITISIEDGVSHSCDELPMVINSSASAEDSAETPIIAAKKRGRKPKGGKLILKCNEQLDKPIPLANVILHLKCSMQDLNDHNTSISHIVTDPLVYNPSIPPNIMTYNSQEQHVFADFIGNNPEKTKVDVIVDTANLAYNEFTDLNKYGPTICKECKLKTQATEKMCINDDDDDGDVNIKDINSKLKKIKLQLYKNSNPDKKSACFWCTYDYDNQTCYIPKYEIDNQLYGYGSFCRPECAVAYLMKESLDDTYIASLSSNLNSNSTFRDYIADYIKQKPDETQNVKTVIYKEKRKDTSGGWLPRCAAWRAVCEACVPPND